MRITPMKGLLALFLLWAGHSQAVDITCRADTSAYPPQDRVFTFNAVISVGDEIPVGKVLYSATLMGRDGIQCMPLDVSGTTLLIPSRWEFISTPTSVVPGITEPHGRGDSVYETNVPGIGVSLTTAHPPGDAGSYTTRPLNQNTWNLEASTLVYFLRLIKTGPVSPGAVNAINFPQAQRSFYSPTATADVNISGFPIRHSSIKFNGTIQIVKSTCRTEVTDKVVDLGSYEVKDFKMDRGFLVTPWKDASLRLTGCQLSGYYGALSGPNVANDSGDVPQDTPTYKNTVGLTVRPMTSLIDARTIALTPTSDSATGVGIQIAMENSTVPLGYSLIDLNGRETIFRPSLNAQSLDIPLIARYVATSDVITPGKANGAIVYTLNYY